MSDVMPAQHYPAMKVGGRRLSISSRPKHHTSSGSAPTSAAEQTENTDYPRPAAQGEEQAHAPPHNEEEAPKKEKKHGHKGTEERRLQESAYRKAVATQPTRDHAGGKHAFGAAGRIVQPMEKALSL
ncbi:hypothetical protein F5I97DRAFT_1255665 [Phlebopus sp. FC_14]|nr:hypothetical protein F5I97DRAFT_1255665 [Phlebopus sp. FC_14]